MDSLQVMIAPPVPAYESAWERGFKQAKEMRRKSSKRREMDVEYEEKKTSQSLTQVELDKENDYYMRPASPANTHDPYADEDGYTDPYDTYHPEVRRIAPPPPPEFLAREERSRYNESPPPRFRRIAPPRSPSPRGGGYVPHSPVLPGPAVPGPQQGRGGGSQGGRFRGEDWADPCMRGGQEKQRMGRADKFGGRRRSYSSESSRGISGIRQNKEIILYKIQTLLEQEGIIDTKDGDWLNFESVYDEVESVKRATRVLGTDDNAEVVDVERPKDKILKH